MLGQVDNYVKLVETLLIYRVQAVVDQLAWEEHTERHNAQVVILALIYGVKTFRVDNEGGDLLTICSLAVF